MTCDRQRNRPVAAARPGSARVAEPGCQELLALLGALLALRLCPAEEVGELLVTGPFRIADVGLQPQGVAQARLGEPDDVVVLVLSPGGLPGLLVGLPAAHRVSPFRSYASGVPLSRFLHS